MSQILGGRRRLPLGVSRLINFSCGIKISVVCSFVLSQSTRVTDGWTDGLMDIQIELRSQDRASIAASRNKNCLSIVSLLILTVDTEFKKKQSRLLCNLLMRTGVRA